MAKQILVVNMNYVGDALMTTPTLNMLAETFQTQLDVIAGGSSGYGASEVFAGHKSIRKVIQRVDGGAFSRCLQLFSVIKRQHYDLIVILPSIPIYRLTAQMAGASHIVYVPQETSPMHMAEHIQDYVAQQIGVPVESREMSIHVSPNALLAASDLLGKFTKSHSLVALNLGGSRPQKRWPIEHFRVACQLLLDRDFDIILLGGSEDCAPARLLSDHFGSRIVDLTAKTSLSELSAVISRCKAVVSGDTAAMHIASALKIPVVALFGSTDPRLTGPHGDGKATVIYKSLACSPCKSHPTCGGKFCCMAEIMPYEVVQEVVVLTTEPASKPLGAYV